MAVVGNKAGWRMSRRGDVSEAEKYRVHQHIAKISAGEAWREYKCIMGVFGT